MWQHLLQFLPVGRSELHGEDVGGVGREVEVEHGRQHAGKREEAACMYSQESKVALKKKLNGSFIAVHIFLKGECFAKSTRRDF